MGVRRQALRVARHNGNWAGRVCAAVLIAAAGGVFVSWAAAQEQAAGGQTFPDFSWADLKRVNEVHWGQQTDVQRFGFQWKMVPTRYLRVHFAAEQAGMARQFAAHADNLWLFLRARAQAEPTPPIDAFLAPSEQMLDRLWAEWRPQEPRALGRSIGSSDLRAFACKPNEDYVGRLGSAIDELCHVFARKRAAQTRGEQGEWTSWAEEPFCRYYGGRVPAAFQSRAFRDEARPRLFPAPSWVALRGWLISESSSARLTGLNLAVSVLFFVEDRFGGPTFDKLWRAMLDAKRGQYAGIQDLFEKTLGQPLSQLEAEWRQFYNLAVPAVGVTMASTRASSPSVKLMSAMSLCQSGQYDQALDMLDSLVDVNGVVLSSYEWGQTYLLAGYAHDRKGERDKAIGRYAVAAALAEQANPVAMWAEKGLVSPLTALPFSTTRFATAAQGDWAAFAELTENHFANLDEAGRARDADQQMQRLRDLPDGEGRWRAIEAVGLLREPRAVPDLLRFVNQRGEAGGYRQSWIAAKALGRIGDRRAVPALIEALTSINRNTQDESLAALRRITGQNLTTQEEWRRWLADNQRQ